MEILQHRQPLLCILQQIWRYLFGTTNLWTEMLFGFVVNLVSILLFHQFQYQGKFFCSLRFLECKMSRNRRMTIGFYWTSLWSLEKLQGLHRYLIISSAHLVGIELYFVKHLLALCGSGYLRWRSTLVPYILYSSLASFMQPTGPGWGDQIQDNPAMHLLQPEGCVVACSNKFLFPNNIKPSGLDLSVKKFADSSRYISSLQIFM